MMMMNGRAISSAFAATALLLAVAPVAAAHHPELDCTFYPREVRYGPVCIAFDMLDGFVHCSLLIAPDLPGYAIGTATHMVVNAGPMLKEMSCEVKEGVNADIRWWNDVWLHTGRPVFCFAWGPSPDACPSSPNGVRAEATEYFVCATTPGQLVLSCQLPTLPPLPPAWIPGPPPYP